MTVKERERGTVEVATAAEAEAAEAELLREADVESLLSRSRSSLRTSAIC